MENGRELFRRNEYYWRYSMRSTEDPNCNGIPYENKMSVGSACFNVLIDDLYNSMIFHDTSTYKNSFSIKERIRNGRPKAMNKYTTRYARRIENGEESFVESLHLSLLGEE